MLFSGIHVVRQPSPPSISRNFHLPKLKLCTCFLVKILSLFIERERERERAGEGPESTELSAQSPMPGSNPRVFEVIELPEFLYILDIILYHVYDPQRFPSILWVALLLC